MDYLVTQQEFQAGGHVKKSNSFNIFFSKRIDKNTALVWLSTIRDKVEIRVIIFGHCSWRCCISISKIVKIYAHSRSVIITPLALIYRETTICVNL